MNSNKQIVLDTILERRQAEIAPEMSPADFFELFTAEQVLKDYDLSYDEIDSGRTGGGGDGGVDGFYLFVNGDLVQDDSDYSVLKSDITLEIIIIQATMSPGFSERTIDRFTMVSDDIFNLRTNPDELGSTYNSGIVESIKRFRDLYEQLMDKFPRLYVIYYYASKAVFLNESVERRVERLESRVRQYFSDIGFEFEFLGASELVDLVRRIPLTTHNLILAENPISSGTQVAFVCLVRLEDFYHFISDEKGMLIRHIFEANVRDYQGRTQVNREIETSLRAKNPEDFWWLNNGVTVVASRASLSGKNLTIEDPQIVNGLQTSVEIRGYFKGVDPASTH